MGSITTAILGSAKSSKQKKKEAKAAEGGHYSKTGRPGSSEQYTGIKPGVPGASPSTGPGGAPRPRSKRLGGARTPMSA